MARDPRAMKQKTMAAGVGAAMKAKADFSLTYIDLEELHDHPKNVVFSMDDKSIISLAQNIEQNGLLEVPLAWVNENGETELISGHRRTSAFRWLRDNVDKDKYKQIPVRFIACSDADEAYLKLLAANVDNREQTNSERARCTTQFIHAAEIVRKNNPNLKGVRSVDIASKLLSDDERKISARTIARLIKLDGYLCDNLKTMWDKGVLSQSFAYELCELSFAKQEEFYQAIKDMEEPLRKSDAEEIRMSLFLTSRSKKSEPEKEETKTEKVVDVNKETQKFLKALLKKAAQTKALIEAGGEPDKKLVSELKQLVKSL